MSIDETVRMYFEREVDKGIQVSDLVKIVKVRSYSAALKSRIGDEGIVIEVRHGEPAPIHVMIGSETQCFYEDELAQSDREVYVGFTRYQLRVAFQQVCDQHDWRLPINGAFVFGEEMLDTVKAAIAYFTSTHTIVIPFGQVKGVNCFMVRADGYYLGPANS